TLKLNFCEQSLTFPQNLHGCNLARRHRQCVGVVVCIKLRLKSSCLGSIPIILILEEWRSQAFAEMKVHPGANTRALVMARKCVDNLAATPSLNGTLLNCLATSIRDSF